MNSTSCIWNYRINEQYNIYLFLWSHCEIMHIFLLIILSCMFSIDMINILFLQNFIIKSISLCCWLILIMKCE